MTAKDFFEQQSTTDANSVINKHAETYNRFDLIRFAQAYHDSEVKKLNTPDVRLSYPLSSSSAGTKLELKT